MNRFSISVSQPNSETVEEQGYRDDGPRHIPRLPDAGRLDLARFPTGDAASATRSARNPPRAARRLTRASHRAGFTRAPTAARRALCGGRARPRGARRGARPASSRLDGAGFRCAGGTGPTARRPAETARGAGARLRVEVELGGDGTGQLGAEPAPRALVKSPGVGWDVPLLVGGGARAG